MPDPQIMLAANDLIHLHGNDAEEHAASRLWSARAAKDAAEAAKWQDIVEALKAVRELRRQILGERPKAKP